MFVRVGVGAPGARSCLEVEVVVVAFIASHRSLVLLSSGGGVCAVSR